MKPVLAKLPPERRALLFLPVAAGVGFLAFFLVGLVTGSFLVAMFAGPLLGAGAAYALLGLPDLRRKDGRPWISEKARPWMSVPTAVVVAWVLYLVVGLAVTPLTFVPLEYAAYITLAIALAGGVAVGLLAFGPPPVARAPVDAWRKIPPERRPWTFFPIAFLVAAVVYYGLGVVLTTYGTERTPQALLALPIAIVSGCALAYFLVGVPRPKRRVADVVPPIPVRARPVLFTATLVALGPVFAILLGPFVSRIPLPNVADLYLGLLAGYVLAFVAASLAWGLPRRWSREGDWRPRMPPNVRLALFAPVGLAVGALALVAANIAGLEFPVALLVGASLGTLAGLWASGALKRVRSAPEAVRDLPEVVKPLVFFAVWFLVGGLAYVAFVSVFFLHPAFGVVTGFTLGLVAAAFAVEWPLFVEQRRARQAARLERKALAEERAKRLAAYAPPKAEKKGLAARLKKPKDGDGS